MTEPCPRNFDQSRLSGYLDRALTQQDEQRVRIHLEDCAACRGTYAELAALREVTMTTRLTGEDERLAGERPRTAASLGIRSLGWILAITWFVVVTGYGLWQAWREEEGAFERFLAFGGLGGAALLLLSVLVDRIRESANDPYREVKR